MRFGMSGLTSTSATAITAVPTNVVWMAGSRTDGDRCSRSGLACPTRSVTRC